ncbi:histidinol-phosphatase [Subtercola boreus]|uniref:Histidinol-phosphatase n=1 Tax=Subtercola boreus TaxID=120213 RepID=A0A3E0WBE0_9MICO|nr:histidinol-phosphatase [Subtercola boreus]RFA20319.1 histidinol-phosphatase [Subtercola boreus]RFA20472.1 histidinol-phosphatase [Subtercola boreus]RFA26722.1 histidinol-phosphatase [Subtercola boreus]
MTEPTLADDLALALELADAADTVSLDRFRSLDLVVEQKPDRTPVTDADRAVERIIRDGLAARRPGDSILGEEYGETGSSPRQWIIDPIDGTANFLRGVPVWATLIALVVDGTPVLGVVSSPAFQKRWWASTGRGAWLIETGPGHTAAPQRLAVSGVTGLTDASISYNSLKGWDEAGSLDDLMRLSRAVWRTRAYGEMWSYMMVAEGLVDVSGEYDLQPYDVAALIPIVEEAGGRFTSLTGGEALHAGNALATNGLLHAETLALLARS